MHNKIKEVIKDLRKGKMVVVVDDEDRENEGDLVIAASKVKPQDINFMAKHGRGLICVPMEGARLDQLKIHSMAQEKKDPFSTAWTISVDAKEGVTTGISAYDRAKTIKTLTRASSKPDDFIRPGHIFPLRAIEGGVLVRAGHTEASVDLMKLADLYPAAVICEIMNDDGTMARMQDLNKFAKENNLKICTIADLIQYRRKSERLIKKLDEASLPTKYGTFKIVAYESLIDSQHHIALVMGKIDKGKDPVLVRVHSECLTGDVFHSLRCDCGNQLEATMKKIARSKKGVILYMSQEGRGIGLIGKIRAYNLQDGGMDTVEANEALGFEPDLRDYGIGAQILVDLGVKRINLLTNNPRKIVGLDGFGLEVVKRVHIETKPQAFNKKYLSTKKKKLGHVLKHVK